ncbi:S49 family peptidase [Aestuariivirga litoralis]|uniref:S49 family peptidase n=1 Tax=Aestuariivirga litoralis TaxID=2650924 RepID=UPI0018C6E4E7|nr:S49 family peptidase [Aestuariivirga litoralis]MBG1233325.1 S49 family peptidase [Aestuariivirga litoralis]
MIKRIKGWFGKANPVVHVVRLEGAISSGRGLQATLNAKNLESILKKAFTKKVSAVALAINCPGGSPVQSALIASRIRALAAETNTPVLAFCEDVAASGGYWLACAADEIHADENSIVGSIGVIASTFGFPKALSKLGVERRVHTAGLSKSTNDPFKPEKPEDVKKLKVLLEDMHASFKNLVRTRRGAKLKGKESDLFSGAYWTGIRAHDLGLVDGIGHLVPTLKQRFGDKVEIKEIKESKGFGARWLGLGSRHGLATEVTEAALNVLEERALWARFGL